MGNWLIVTLERENRLVDLVKLYLGNGADESRTLSFD